MKLNQLIDELRRVDRERGPDYVREFEAILSDVASLSVPSVIDELVLFLDDENEVEELMFSIIHVIENFDDGIYIERILKIAPRFCATNPKWASIVFMRILNSDSTRLELIEQLRGASGEVKISIRNLMDGINSRGHEFLAKTGPVMAATM